MFQPDSYSIAFNIKHSCVVLIHLHTLRYLHIHSLIHTCTLTDACSDALKHMHACAHTHTHTHTHTNMQISGTGGGGEETEDTFETSYDQIPDKCDLKLNFLSAEMCCKRTEALADSFQHTHKMSPQLMGSTLVVF